MTYKSILKQFFILSAAIVCLAGSGCGQKNEAPVSLPIAQAPQAMETAFKDAKPELKKKADAATAALKDKKYDIAVMLLQDLSVLSDLTSKQRQAATGSMLAANLEMKAAAEKGDAQAAELMNARRMNK